MKLGLNKFKVQPGPVQTSIWVVQSSIQHNTSVQCKKFLQRLRRRCADTPGGGAKISKPTHFGPPPLRGCLAELKRRHVQSTAKIHVKVWISLNTENMLTSKTKQKSLSSNNT